MAGLSSRVCFLPSEPDVPLVLSEHSVERFRDRFRPGLSLTDALSELGRLVAVGEVVSDVPTWVESDPDQVPDAVITVGDDMALLIMWGCGRFTAVTCLGRGTIRPSERTRRRRHKRVRRRSDNQRRQRRTHQPIDWQDEARLEPAYS